ncbi:MAG: dihydroorotate dehydrogenase electron transfer subunit, partial [Chloroflexota bacterium]
MKLSSYPIIFNREVLPGTYLLWLEAPDIATQARPGQFAMLRCGEDTQRTLRRPLSIHSVEGRRAAFYYRVVGKGTEWLARRVEGDMLDVFGPLGNGFSIAKNARSLLLVAGGLGIAPLRFLAERSAAQGQQVVLLHGMKTASELYPLELRPAGVRFVAATEDGTLGEKGMVTALVPRLAAQADQAFACGPEAMYRALARDKTALPPGLKVQISLEVRLGCGVGACLGCTVSTRSGPRHVCHDGPVFDLDEVAWESMSG